MSHLPVSWSAWGKLEVATRPPYFCFAPNVRHRHGVSVFVPANYEPCYRANPRRALCVRLDHSMLEL